MRMMPRSAGDDSLIITWAALLLLVAYRLAALGTLLIAGLLRGLGLLFRVWEEAENLESMCMSTVKRLIRKELVIPSFMRPRVG